jgi:Na+-transporting NADH:ubiquinone oxidoreductase subunit C
MPESDTKRGASVTKTLLIALLVSLACSSLVASAAVLLRPIQVENRVRDIRRNILEVAGLLDAGADEAIQFEKVEARVIDFDTGRYVDDIDAAAFDPVEAAKDPEGSVAIPPEVDRARLGRRAKRGLVYLVREDGAVTRIILPISGYGLWSTMRGFLALEPDASTIADITFYEHGETPGLGDFIAEPVWQSLWQGKKAYDDSGTLQIEVVKGRVAADDPKAAHRVDGVSGATLTGNGVSYLVRYWLGDHGYGPFLERFRKGEGT